MRVLVLGAGVVGVATAYALHRHGLEVTIVDRQALPAAETSRGNAGHVCPSYATPWAAPGMRSKGLTWALKGWVGMETALRLTPRLDLAQWNWLKRFAGECTAERYQANKARMGRIARYSHLQLKAMREELALDYQQTTHGNLQVFRDDAGMRNAELASKVLTDSGVPHQMMSVDECLKFEPALSHARETIVGGLLMPMDETGNSQRFTAQLFEWLLRHGVQAKMNTVIRGIKAEEGQPVGIFTDRGELNADAIVLACANDSVRLSRPLGIHLPIYPVKGYAITVPVTDESAAPRGGVMDEALKVAITRMGNTLRAAGTAELGARDLRVSHKDCATPIRSVSSLFPRGADVSKAQLWAGARPMTPDGAPLIGATRVKGVYLATGGGSNGWTTSCGVGRAVADVVAGKAPELNLSEFSAERFL
jgi:D-amino-acid dehydrogenase